jgi:hypothetical protein
MKVLAEALKKLWHMPEGLSASSLTENQRQELDIFCRQTNAVEYQGRGRGGVYKTVIPELIEGQLKVLLPGLFTSVDVNLPARTQNIAAARNSKATMHGMEYEYLLVKGIDAEALWHGDDGVSLDVFGLTQQAGVAALRIQSGDVWHSAAPLWLVENQTLFDRLDWLPADASGTLCYYAGNPTRRLLEWLAYRERTSQIILFPDYDGVGLQNFVRLLDATNGKCEFWLMPNWEILLKQYGNAQVFVNNLDAFCNALPKLQKLDGLIGVQHLVKQMKELGLALEQESVWL